MHNTTPARNFLLAIGLLLFAPHLALAQGDDPPGLTVGPGATVTILPGSTVSTIGGDVHVQEGGTLRNDGDLIVGRDLILDGALQTTLAGTADAPAHGQIHVAGDAEYRGTLAVALARGSHFRDEQDFVIATYGAGFGTLSAEQLPGASWSREHREDELVVSLSGRANATSDNFAIELDGALLDQRILIDWVAYRDDRTTVYVIERYDRDAGWQAIGETASIGGATEAAYYTTIDDELPDGQQVLRYRLRLRDDTGDWNLTRELSIAIGDAPKLRVFPNPVTDSRVRLLGLDPSKELVSLRLMSTEGRQLRTYPTEARNIHVLDLPTNLAAAVHYLEVGYADGTRKSCPVLVVK